MNNDFRQLLQLNNPVSKIIIAIVTLSIAAILYSIAANINESTSGHEAAHEERSADSSLVAIDGENILNTDNLSAIEGRVLNNLYAKHYEKTGLIERKATFSTNLKKVDTNTYKFSLSFMPSRTKYEATLAVNNIDEKEFSIEVK